MSFLQPLLLAAMPLIALPIIIHLINQRRYQTIRWGAMMFLLAANRMSRGYARLRQWLIMAFRMLAIAGLIFAISRPLSSGWLGVTAGGRPDTTLILLDRSPSMQQNRDGASASKLETGRQQLVQALQTLGSGRWVLIESTTGEPRELESPDALLTLPAAEATSAAADLPTMLQSAHDYIRDNRAGRTEIWICSDLRENDWNAESGRWKSLRDAFVEFTQGVRFHLLAYPQQTAGNVAVRVTDVRRRQVGDAAELLLSLRLTRAGGEEGRHLVPLHIEVAGTNTPDSPGTGETGRGARLELTVEMDGPQYELKAHRIPLERTQVRGWGRVSLPADTNPADNEFCFVFDQPPVRHTLIVAEDAAAARPLQLAAAIAPDPAVQCTAEIVAPDQLSGMDWNQVALLLWQGPLPGGDGARLVTEFVERGGEAVFFPPAVAGDAELFGVRWQGRTEAPENTAVETWRADQDLLAHTQSGSSLPVGALEIHRYCGLAGEFTPLAALRGGAPLLARVATRRGGAYFCTTTPAAADSSLATGGVVLYVLVQRALAVGAAALGNTRPLVAGDPQDNEPARWQPVSVTGDGLSAEYAWQAGVYTSGSRLLAVNRSAAEDQAAVLADHRVAELFRGLDFARVDDQAGSLTALVQEIWRIFLTLMIVALIVEAALCLPRPAHVAGGSP